MEKRKIILPNKKYFGAIDENQTINIGLETSKNLLREGDRTIILDTSVLFDKERNESPNYKIHGKLRMVFRNLYSGTTTYSPLEKQLYLVGDGSTNDFTGFLPYNEFAFGRQDVVREKIDTHTTTVAGQYSPNTVLTGTNDHLNIDITSSKYHNWGVYLSYVFGQDDSYPMTYTLTGNTSVSFVSGDGIPFRVVDNGKTYKLTSPVEHGMSEGEYIYMSGGTMDSTLSDMQRTILIYEVGDEFHNSEKYVIHINKSELPSGTVLPTIILGKRCLNRNNITDTLSTYYVHKHKTLTTNTDCTLDNLGFESSIWENEKKIILENSVGESDVLVERNRMETMVYDFKTPFVLTGLTNNLGYTPTDVYVSTIFKNSNGYFEYPYKVGYKFNFHDSWIDEHFDGSGAVETSVPTGTFNRTVNSSTFTFTTGGTIPVGTELVGSFIEYNRYELKERVVSETFHKLTIPTAVFNHQQDDPTTYSGASATNMVGLYYQAHHKVLLRQLSPYVENSSTDDIYNLPQNAKYFETDKQWKWRDIYDHGFTDPDGYGTNFPYMNNIHYVKKDINFYLRNEQQYNNKRDGIKFFTNFNC